MARYEVGQIRVDRGLFIDKGNYYIDPRHPDYDGGARGDGVHDDRRALAAADAEAVALGCGLKLGIGTYYVGSALTIASDISIPQGAAIKPASGVTVTITGAVDRPDSTWANTTLGGTVTASGTRPTTKAIVDALTTRVSTAESDITAIEADVAVLDAGQTAGMLGFENKLAMDADLAHIAGVLAYVTNDVTPANNGVYRKTGGSGSGSWVAASNDRIASVEDEVDDTNEFVAQIATGEPVILDGESLSVSIGVPRYNTGTYSGWGSPVGIHQGFNAVTVYIRSWSEAAPVTSVRVRIHETDKNGSLLADKTVSVSPVLNVDTPVFVQLDDVIENAGEEALWVSFFTDGYTGSLMAYQEDHYPTDSYPTASYHRLNFPDPLSLSEQATPYVLKVIFHEVGEGIIATPTSEFAERVATAIGFEPTNYDQLLLTAVPPVFYATQGLQFNAYWDNIAHVEGTARTFDPGVRFIGLPSGYRVLDECVRALPEPGDDGQYAATIKLYSQGALRLEKASVLKVTDATAAATTIKALFIGDSTTAAGGYTARLVELATADAATALTLIGTQGSAPNLHEGRGGWTIADYNDDTEEVSPFIFDGSFDFAEYLSFNGLETPDMVFIMLGINDIRQQNNAGHGFGAAWDAYCDTQLEKLEDWITSIKAANASAKIGICTTITPAGIDGWGNAGLQERYTYLRHRFQWVRVAHERFSEREADGIYVIPTGTCLDTRYGYPFDAAEPINAHVATTIVRQGDSVHPSQAGYNQIGDCIWSALKCLYA